jgi:hypothetical protein
MKKLVTCFLAAALLLCAAALAYAIHETIPSETQVPLPDADAGKLYEYITKYHNYTSWELWPGKGRFYKGTEPHGALLTTYVNSKAYFSIGKGKMDDASIIVKENYTQDKKLAALTVMYKIKGFNPAAGDWFWAKYGPFGKVEISGKADMCIGCHGKNKDNDYIMTHTLKK